MAEGKPHLEVHSHAHKPTHGKDLSHAVTNVAYQMDNLKDTINEYLFDSDKVIVKNFAGDVLIKIKIDENTTLGDIFAHFETNTNIPNEWLHFVRLTDDEAKMWNTGEYDKKNLKETKLSVAVQKFVKELSKKPRELTEKSKKLYELNVKPHTVLLLQMQQDLANEYGLYRGIKHLFDIADTCISTNTSLGAQDEIKLKWIFSIICALDYDEVTHIMDILINKQVFMSLHSEEHKRAIIEKTMEILKKQQASPYLAYRLFELLSKYAVTEANANVLNDLGIIGVVIEATIFYPRDDLVYCKTPTVRDMVRHLLDELSKQGVDVKYVTVYETMRSMVCQIFENAVDFSDDEKFHKSSLRGEKYYGSSVYHLPDFPGSMSHKMENFLWQAITPCYNEVANYKFDIRILKVRGRFLVGKTKDNTSDPYFVAGARPEKGHKFSPQVKSSKLRETTTPEWDMSEEKANVVHLQENQDFSIRIYHGETFSSHFIGSMSFVPAFLYAVQEEGIQRPDPTGEPNTIEYYSYKLNPLTEEDMKEHYVTGDLSVLMQISIH